MPELPPRLRVLYPFEPKRFETPAGGLSYVDEGTGPVMVMLHGNPTWSFFYRDLVIGMRDTHRCLVPDHLGCGLSDKPREGDYTLAGHIERTCAWLESLDLDSIHLVVHDWGGAIGFGVADRLPGIIRRITILNTAAFTFPALPARIGICRVPLLGALLVRGLNGFARGATRMTTVRPLSPGVKEGFLLPYDSWASRVAVHAFVKDIPMHRSHPSWRALRDIEDGLDQWRQVPVQIIWGMHDWCFHPRILACWEAILPDASIHRLESAGHYLLEDAGEEVLSLVRDFAAQESEAPTRP